MAVISNGTTIIDAGAVSAGSGQMILIKTLTASNSGSLSFVNGAASVVLDDTYDSYMFKFIDIHPATDAAVFQFNVSIDTGSNYNVAKTTTNFRAYQAEDGSSTSLNYHSSEDLAQGTGFQTLCYDIGNDNDQSASGSMTLFNPSSTVFVKHFISSGNMVINADYAATTNVGGYANTTSAVDAVQFKMNSGNIGSGVIKLYGIGG